MNISKRLKDIRNAKNISVYKLSQLSDVSERDLERGDKNPSLDTLSKIATPLGMTLSELLNETDDVSYLNKKEKTLVECFRHLSDDKADTLLSIFTPIKKTRNLTLKVSGLTCVRELPSAPQSCGKNLCIIHLSKIMLDFLYSFKLDISIKFCIRGFTPPQNLFRIFSENKTEPVADR